MTIEPRPARAIAPPITWHGTTTPSTLTWTTRSSESSGTSSNGPTSSAGASGGASIAAALTSRCGDAPVRLDERERRLDGRPVGHVADVRPDRAVLAPGREPALRAARSAQVEDRDAHPPRRRAPPASSAPSWPSPPVTTATRPERSKRGSVTATILRTSIGGARPGAHLAGSTTARCHARATSTGVTAARPSTTEKTTRSADVPRCQSKGSVLAK